MKLPKNKQEMARLTRRSFITGGVTALLSLGAWKVLLSYPDDQGIPSPLRRVLEANGRLWSALFSTSRLTGQYPRPPEGKLPRYNGDLGLDENYFDPKTWRLKIIDGGRTLELTLEQLKLLPKTENTTEFHCIEGWSDVNTYGGLRFSEFVKTYGLGKSGSALSRYVGLETPDGGYYVSIDMDSMLHPETLLCYEVNGKPLAPKNGAPLRLVIPIKYGIKSIKRIGTIRFSDERPRDYWAERGYDWFAGL
jgi:DMSO/TMAO reductase YedYZ molybdopterin-dependent catalytic subunit